MERHRALYTTAQSPSPSFSSYTISCGEKAAEFSADAFFRAFSLTLQGQQKASSERAFHFPWWQVQCASPRESKHTPRALGGVGAGDKKAGKKNPKKLPRDDDDFPRRPTLGFSIHSSWRARSTRSSMSTASKDPLFLSNVDPFACCCGCAVPPPAPPTPS
jgi:hypothetical protein